MKKESFINSLTKKDVEQILKNCGYKLLSLEECEKQFAVQPYKKHNGIITCYCVVSPDDMTEYLERKSIEQNSKKYGELSKTRLKMELIKASLGQLYNSFYYTEKNNTQPAKQSDTNYVRKVVFEDFFVKEIKKKNNKQNIFEKVINKEFEDYMSSKFSFYAKQREVHYQKLFSNDQEETF